MLSYQLFEWVKKIMRVLIILLLACHLLSCHTGKSTHAPKGTFVLLSINDVYRAEGLDEGARGGLPRVRALREKLLQQSPHVLLLHAGDFLQPSFSSRVNRGAAMIDAMNRLDGAAGQFDPHMLVTFGNHEFDRDKLKDVPTLQARIDESEFNWLDSNIHWGANGIASDKLIDSVLLTINGVKVGLYSVTSDMQHPEYIDAFDAPQATSRHWVPKLRAQGADVVIALTHQWLSADKEIAELPAHQRPDLIYGGHEHDRQLLQHNGVWIVKADADAVSAAVTEVQVDASGRISALPVFIDLDETQAADAALAADIKAWQLRTAETFCTQRQRAPDCLSSVLAHTAVDLIAEETEIRRFETNLGNFIADTALQAFASCGADVALINSGSLRLNHNIAAGSAITEAHMEGLFPYPGELNLIRINGRMLLDALKHSIDYWTGNGHWLQIAGFVYMHDSQNQRVEHVHLKGHAAPLAPDDTILAVVPQYLIDANTDHDGYTMFNESMRADCAHNGERLKDLVAKKLRDSVEPIAPIVDHRICNVPKDHCL